MATEIQMRCANCGHREPVAPMYDFLKAVSRSQLHCGQCGSSRCTLALHQPFGLGAERQWRAVEAAFAPKRSIRWGRSVETEFVPFLVITRGLRDGERHAWLPYWHLKRRGREVLALKYGQWAPSMNLAVFGDLLKQARRAGYLRRV